jgi:hypothetical protein
MAEKKMPMPPGPTNLKKNLAAGMGLKEASTKATTPAAPTKRN